jgi:hypothetical protein
VNLAMMRLCGLDRGAIIGSRIEQLVSPEEREFCFVSVRQAALSGKIQRLELKFLKAGESCVF